MIQLRRLVSLSRVKEIRALEANLQNLAVVADEPSGFRVRKTDRPITAHVRQCEPGLSFVWTPCGCAGAEVRQSFSGDHHTAVMFVGEVVSMAPIILVFRATRIGETEDRSCNGRFGGEGPTLTAIMRGCRLGSTVRGQVATTDNAMPGIAESHREATRTGVAYQRSVIRIPGVAAIPSRQDPSDA